MSQKRGRPSLMPNTRSEPLSVRLPVPVYDALMARAIELRTTPRDLVREGVRLVLSNGVTEPRSPQ